MVQNQLLYKNFKNKHISKDYYFQICLKNIKNPITIFENVTFM